MSDRIAIINASTTLGDLQVAAMVEACRIQLHRDFAPAWGIDAFLYFVRKGVAPPRGFWQIAILDDSDAAGALGYHDITPEGLPLGKVFVKPTLRQGGYVSVTLAHELMEILADPSVNLLVQDGRNVRRFWAYEVCDPCQRDQDGYTINNIQVSNFVLPSYFETFRTPTMGPFDQRGLIKAPVPALLAGGYMIYVEEGRWGQLFPRVEGTDKNSEALRLRQLWQSRPQTGGRRYRRMVGSDRWLPSDIALGPSDGILSA